MNDSTRRYKLELLISMAVYVVMLIGSQLIYLRLPDHPAKVLLLVLPVVPVLFAFRAFIRHMRGMDELQQRIQMEAFAFSLGLTGILTFTYGFLEGAGYPRIGLIWVLPLSIALWGIGLAIASRRY